MNPYVESLKVIWQNARYCSIDYEALDRVAQGLLQKELILPDWRAPVFPEDDEVIIEFFGVSNAINFCFTDFSTEGKFDVEYPEGSGKIWIGAYAMFASLKRALDEGIEVLNPRFLEKFTEEEARYIFRHITTPIPMLAERVENVKDLGRTLRRSAKVKSFSDLFLSSDFFTFRDGNGIVERLTRNFSCYYDASPWNSGRYILHFHKRAQLLAMMYYGRAMSSGGALEPLRDPERIGPIADYQVPKGLRSLGILTYQPILAGKVDHRIPIYRDSIFEIEIRAQTVRAMCELLLKINALRPKDKQITMAELDYAVWLLGRKSEGHHHYTFTTAY